jgi:hypothetical protein
MSYSHIYSYLFLICHVQSTAADLDPDRTLWGARAVSRESQHESSRHASHAGASAAPFQAFTMCLRTGACIQGALVAAAVAALD